MDPENTDTTTQDDDLALAEKPRLVSEKFEDFHEALQVLYIPANISGRLKFLENWPAVAAYIFPEDLIRRDTEGTDTAQSMETLIEKSQERQIELLEIAEEFEDKAVLDGILQKEYVAALVEKLGVELAELYLDREVIEKAAPKAVPPPPEEKSTEVEEPSQPVAGGGMKYGLRINPDAPAGKPGCSDADRSPETSES